MNKSIISLQLRIPVWLRDEISEKAAQNFRSLNGEILSRLALSIMVEGERQETPEK